LNFLAETSAQRQTRNLLRIRDQARRQVTFKMEGLPDQRPRHARRGRVHLLLQRVLPNGFHRSIPAGRPEPFQVADVVLSRSEASMSFAGL